MKVTQTLTWEASHESEDGGSGFSVSCSFISSLAPVEALDGCLTGCGYYRY